MCDDCLPEARTRLATMKKKQQTGVEFTELNKKILAVDAALCLVPDRIPSLSLQEMRSFVKHFEEVQELPLNNKRLISILFISDAFGRGSLDIAMAHTRIWGGRADDGEWSVNSPLFSATFPDESIDEASIMPLAMKAFINPALLNAITAKDTQTPRQWAELYLAEYDKAARAISTLPNGLQNIARFVVNIAQGILAIASPEPQPFDSTAAVEHLFPSTREKRRAMDPSIAALRDAVLQTRVWNSLLELFEKHKQPESMLGEDFRKCLHALNSDDETVQTEAMKRASKSIEDWRSQLRPGATNAMERRMQDLLVQVCDWAAQKSTPAERVQTMHNVKVLLDVFESTPESVKLAQRVEKMLNDATAEERRDSWATALQSHDPEKLKAALLAFKGTSLSKKQMDELMGEVTYMEQHISTVLHADRQSIFVKSIRNTQSISRSQK